MRCAYLFLDVVLELVFGVVFEVAASDAPSELVEAAVDGVAFLIMPSSSAWVELITAAPFCTTRAEVSTAKLSAPILMVAVCLPLAPGFTWVIWPMVAPVLSFTERPVVIGTLALVFVPAPAPALTAPVLVEPALVEPVPVAPVLVDPAGGIVGSVEGDEDGFTELEAGGLAVELAGGADRDGEAAVVWAAAGRAAHRASEAAPAMRYERMESP